MIAHDNHQAAGRVSSLRSSIGPRRPTGAGVTPALSVVVMDRDRLSLPARGGLAAAKDVENQAAK
jgi:hypothetical protein